MSGLVHFSQDRIDTESCALHLKGYDDHEIEIRNIDGEMHAVPLGWQRPLTLLDWQYDVYAVPPKYATGGGK